MKNQPQSALPYSFNEEVVNVVTHGVGLLLAIAGLVYLILKAEGTLQVASVSIYGGSLILMFLASTIYHAVTHPTGKQWLKVFDHSAIYILIAGTYTPFLLIGLDGWVSLASIVFIWSMALFGVVFKMAASNRFPKVSLVTYLSMGWFALAIIYPLYQAVGSSALWLLLAGGVLFSVGVVFYVAKHRAYSHGIWHMFVVGGCVCHFYSVYGYVI